MIATSLLQLVVTVWVGVHPVTYTLPKLYATTSHACQDRANALYAQKRKGVRMVIECVPTAERQA